MAQFLKAQAASRDIFPTPSNDLFLQHGIYASLDATQQHIRLIRLSLDDHDGLIECHLLHPVPLAQARGNYTAISYCAGDPTKTSPILVNGVRFNVFANLAHVLDATRDYWRKTFPAPNSTRDCLLWADQICINQADLAERSHQVGFMRSIYACAEQTLICLSTGQVETKGIEWLIQLHESVDPQGDFYMYYFRLEHHLRTKLADPRFTDGWLAFYDIFKSPWWTRTWVYQEFISSTNIVFLYGKSSIPWRRVSEILPTLRKYRNFDHFGPHLIACESEVTETIDVVNFFVISKIRFDRVGPYDLMDLLAQSRHLRSTDSRDRIYAFLGLVQHDFGIVPDYSPGNTIENLLVDVASKIIAQTKRLDILSYACAVRGPLSSHIPSWVPDWTSTSCSEVRTRTIQDPEDMCSNLPSPRIVLHSSGHHVLETQGYYLGTLGVVQNWEPRVEFHGGNMIAEMAGLRYGRSKGGEGDQFWALLGARNILVLRRSTVVDSAYQVVEEAEFRRNVNVHEMARRYALQCQTVLIV
ncbi:heterokaryon incompatibility protein-domain-containing protein [Cercophora scortea]|uniref:Heterokaryon incompatibility protein-domain-containing protein n=1 Tax=Cercophora scortea TaxID=314031 RepID=A0AAE0MDC5_9PEZI|nr:heterokaryon incompatibility protein-domain-containing protein [Cercophora scortea]